MHAPMLTTPSFACWKDGALVSTHELAPGTHEVGRNADAQIVVEHPSCSRRHAHLTVTAEMHVSITDDGSQGGTCVDNVEIEPHKPYVLHDCAKVQFGASSRSYLLQAPRSAAQAPARSGLSSGEKKKLLWGGKRASKTTCAWAAASAGTLGAERGEKFMALTGAKRQRDDEPSAGGSSSASGRDDAEAQRSAREQAQLFATLERQFDQARGGGARRAM